MRKVARQQSAPKGSAPIVSTVDASLELTPPPDAQPLHGKQSSGVCPLPTADVSPPPSHIIQLGLPGGPGSSTGLGGDFWDITLGAFWIAVLCCAMITAFALLGPKKPVILPDSEPATFTVGSSRQQVRAVQGEPTAVEGKVWRYGASRVYFDGNLVVGWRTAPDHPLRVLQPPPRKR